MTANDVTLSGNLTADPEHRTIQSGASLTTFRIGSTQRRRDPSTGLWRDVSTVFVTVSCWRSVAEHVRQSVRKGDRVVVHGRLEQNSWTADDGTPRSRYEIAAHTVAVDLSRVAATLHRRATDPDPHARSAHLEAGVDLRTGEPFADADGPVEMTGGTWDDLAPDPEDVDGDDEVPDADVERADLVGAV